MSEKRTSGGFQALGLPPSILNTLDQLGFDTPTPIQNAAIPLVLDGCDVIGIAQTGTGKTLAFGLPIVARLMPGEMALVLAPTRELALQIEETFRQIGATTALLIGGAPIRPQVSKLHLRPDVVVATPGRLLDHVGQRNIDLRAATVVVLDEADRMLDMGFAPDIRRILDQTLDDRQTLLFSATMPPEIEALAKRYLYQPERVEFEGEGTAAELVRHELVVVNRNDKSDMLYDLLRDHRGSVLVFSRTKHGAHELARTVRGFGHTVAELHSDRSLEQRQMALKGFKNGAYRVLVATDIAARGIDVKDIELVVNFDVPTKPEDYVHRIGRTGRAGVKGLAITLATPEQHRDVTNIEKLIHERIMMSARSPLSMERSPLRNESAPRREGRRRSPRARTLFSR